MDPEPVKVKVYGIFSVTKQKYIYQLIMTVLLAGCLLYAWQAMRPQLAPGKAPKEFAPVMWWIDRVPYAVMVILGLVCVEAILVFRAFARKEAAQRDELAKQASAGTPATAPATDAPVPESSTTSPAPPVTKSE